MADILIIVVDASDPEVRAQLEVTETCSASLSFAPVLMSSITRPRSGGILPDPKKAGTVYISALSGQGLEQLAEKLEPLVLWEAAFLSICYSHERASALNIL